jgi:hypothetical protein
LYILYTIFIFEYTNELTVTLKIDPIARPMPSAAKETVMPIVQKTINLCISRGSPDMK